MKINKNQLSETINKYLQFCYTRKNLSQNTIKAYSIDLNQYNEFIFSHNWLSKKTIKYYIEYIHQTYKPKSVKRKIASLKAFFHYLELEELIEENPFHKISIKYKEPFILPKTIPFKYIEQIINFAYSEYNNTSNHHHKKIALRNILIIEILFATGMRISELCMLTIEQIDINDYIIKILGKGSKERLIQICNKNVQNIIDKYITFFNYEINKYGYFFTNRLHKRLSEQSVRNIINQYAKNAGINIHITPHMFRHSFATLLLEADVDIRYIQQMLGHSSITTTQIYTHTNINKQKLILSSKHPRNRIEIVI